MIKREFYIFGQNMNTVPTFVRFMSIRWLNIEHM